jgi:hypothetical protein
MAWTINAGISNSIAGQYGKSRFYRLDFQDIHNKDQWEELNAVRMRIFPIQVEYLVTGLLMRKAVGRGQFRMRMDCVSIGSAGYGVFRSV